jgi:GNAT superfamily N-acetyltransferase
MMKFILEYCYVHEIEKIWLWTQEELADAIRFYEKMGFQFEGKQHKQFCGKDAVLYGMILTQKK